ncbi:hypothetical protein [Porphyrobacter sp. AAP60]|uniref:hypothetical protein n=1 Tax=Porphyrobacter sp. AAP60 TaxID=1523423 RepID=UPI0006B94F22|nr:hypothetical protein [Porphyrobacter sp. AAP60]KPF63213.1 hypothetical protein IP79_09920 [Porphyrobacter sp. AAP60]
MMTNRIALAAGAALLCIAGPVTAQLPPELAAFDAQVPGDLINDPTRIDWESYGQNYETSGRQAADIPGGGAARVFTVKAKGANPYDVATNVPLLVQIGSGDRVTVGFYARTVSTERSDGKGIIGVRFQENAAPYGGFGDTNLLIGSDWDWYEVTARADKRIRKADAIVALQLAGAKQQIEIGQTIVVKGSETIVAKTTVAAAAPQPTLKDPATIEMPDSLRSAGQLINDPTQRGWGHGGTAGTWQELDVPEIWLQKATRFTATQVGENRWDLSTSVPFATAVKEGDQMMVAVVARTISAETEDGKGVIYARIQGSFPPFEGFGDKVFKIGDRWQMVNLPFTATRAFGTGDATVALHFAGAKQNVEVGPVYVFKTN